MTQASSGASIRKSALDFPVDAVDRPAQAPLRQTTLRDVCEFGIDGGLEVHVLKVGRKTLVSPQYIARPQSGYSFLFGLYARTMISLAAFWRYEACVSKLLPLEAKVPNDLIPTRTPNRLQVLEDSVLKRQVAQSNKVLHSKIRGRN